MKDERKEAIGADTNQNNGLEAYKSLMSGLFSVSMKSLKNFKISEISSEKERNAWKSYKWIEGETLKGRMNQGENPFSFDNVVTELYGENRVDELRDMAYELLDKNGTLEYFARGIEDSRVA